MQLVHLKPIEHPLLDRLDQIARFLLRLLARVAADERRAFEDCVVELARLRLVRADGADEGARLQPLAAEDRILGGRDRDNDVLLGGVAVRLAGLGAELAAERCQPLFAAAVRDHALDCRAGLADAGDLRFRLPAAADYTERTRSRFRQMFRGDPTRSACTKLSQLVRLEQSRDLGALEVEQHNDKRRAAGQPRVRLQTSAVELRIRGCHYCEDTVLHPHARTRTDLDGAARHSQKTFFDRGERVGGSQQLRNLGLRQVKRHLSPSSG